jgi:hypothetical protein
MQAFQGVGRLFLQLLQLVVLGESRTVSRAPVYYIFAASGTIPFPGADSIFSTCCGAISGRLRFCRQALSRRDSGDRKLLCSKTHDRPGDLRRDGAVRTNIERLRNSGKKFVERHDQGHGMFLIASVAASRSSAKSEGESISMRYVSAQNDIAYAPRRAIL